MNPLSLSSEICRGVLVDGLGSGTGGTGIILKMIILKREIRF